MHEGPVFVVWAEDDPSVKLSGSEHRPRSYRDFTLQTIPRCGHFAMIEKPAVLVDAIRAEFLA